MIRECESTCLLLLLPMGKTEFSMDFAYTVPEYGADRTGVLKTQKRKYLCHCAMVS